MGGGMAREGNFFQCVELLREIKRERICEYAFVFYCYNQGGWVLMNLYFSMRIFRSVSVEHCYVSDRMCVYHIFYFLFIFSCWLEYTFPWYDSRVLIQKSTQNEVRVSFNFHFSYSSFVRLLSLCSLFGVGGLFYLFI